MNKEKNIIDKVISYFETQKEIYGNNLISEKINSEEIIENTPLDPDYKSKLSPSTKQQEPSKVTVDPSWINSKSLDELNDKIKNCLECKLGLTRKNFVFGSGNPNADIMIIGEAPGASEDELGLPFVGRAGQLLTKILEAINLSREEVYIANIVKSRPPDNRRPEKSEIDKCEPYLKKQIEIINPAFILSLGLTSVDSLLKKTHKMSEIRGKILDYEGRKMLVTYHPAALLRNPHWKKFAWEDVQLLRMLYDDYLISKKKNSADK